MARQLAENSDHSFCSENASRVDTKSDLHSPIIHMEQSTEEAINTNPCYNSSAVLLSFSCKSDDIV